MKSKSNRSRALSSSSGLALILWVTLSLGPVSASAADAGAACAMSTGTFPAMAYSRSVYQGNNYKKKQIFLANSAGNCEVLVYDTGSAVNMGRVRFHYNALDGTAKLAWWQQNELSGKNLVNQPAVRVATFSVVDGAVQGALPMTPTDARVKKVWMSPSQSYFGIQDVALSRDGNRLAFSTGSGAFNVTGSVTMQVRICCLNVAANAPAGCGTPDTLFTRTQTSAATQSGGTFMLSIGRNVVNAAERVYFVYRPNESWSHGDIVYVEKLGSGLWQAPVVLIDRLLQYPGDPNPGVNDPDVLSIDGAPDRLAFYHDADASTHADPGIDVLDTGTGVLRRDVGVGYRPSWTLNPSIDAAPPNVLVDTVRTVPKNPRVGEIDVDDGFGQAVLGAAGYWVDSSY